MASDFGATGLIEIPKD